MRRRRDEVNTAAGGAGDGIGGDNSIPAGVVYLLKVEGFF